MEWPPDQIHAGEFRPLQGEARANTSGKTPGRFQSLCPGAFQMDSARPLRAVDQIYQSAGTTSIAIASVYVTSTTSPSCNSFR